MSFFVVVTFDLRGAKTSVHGLSVYRKLSDAFKRIDFSRFITGRKKRTLRKLPANTFVAEFEGDDFDHSKALVAYVKQQVLLIFKAHKIRSHYFVSVGQRWAWATGQAV